MDDNQEILNLIEQAAKEGRTELNLRGNQLASVPLVWHSNGGRQDRH